MTRDAMGELAGLTATATAPMKNNVLRASANETETPTSRLVSQLKEMASQAGEMLFRRAGMAMQILSDRDWIAAPPFNGDRGMAEDTLGADCFPEASLIPGGFSKILTLRGYYPDVAKWRDHQFNVVRLWREYEKDTAKKKPAVASPPPPALKPKLEDVIEEKKSLEYRLKRSEQERDRQLGEVRRQMEQKVGAVQKEMESKETRLAELECQVGALNAKLVEKDEWIKAQDMRIADLEEENDRLKEESNRLKAKLKEQEDTKTD